MCVIAGQFGLSDTSFAEKALAALKHRGPDGNGVWQGGQTTLVHTRLAILDLSGAGTQPMVFEGRSRPSTARPDGDSSDGHRQVLVFNGEIYNYLELRDELEAQGETFVGRSDTEVLLRLLVREGEACLPKLAGMFAFAFWDEAAGSALLARDPLGIKPLYYRQEDGGLAFASETRVLRKDGDATDTLALRDFFLWGSVQEPATLNTAVRQLPAGHGLKWKNGILEIKQWHPVTRSDTKPRNPESTAAQTREALLESTRYMRNQLLRDSDVFSMAHGLELRVPFVDARLLSQISGISTGERLRQGKQLLLDAVPEVPEWIRKQTKRGFSFPFQQWLEGQFGGTLAEAQRVSHVPLKSWYRIWAVAVAMRALARPEVK